MNRYICIHGHFYQPPRENPWLEEIEVQDSAYPYRDWNERISAECYSPNTAARILGENNTIIDITNNYSKISFNFGPTLLSWMEAHAPDVYEGILKADKESMVNFSGHGSAIAQVYNHMIMPLANRRDKKTQVVWGIEDFRHRFGREPEGMWLAETAADIETLEVLAELGIKFTILAPGQAGKVRKLGSKKWNDVSGGKVDPKKAYICNLPSGNSINLFFYDGAVSQEIAFGDLLKSGEKLAGRLVDTFNSESEETQLAHIATDGETYGHHQSHGDMGLAYCLHYIASNNLAQITVYGEFLEKFPPEYEAEIIENTSWSCAHGVERWRSDCGCSGGHPGWNQKWRAPLRESLDWLREKLNPVFENEMNKYVKDPWQMRDEYIKVILDRNQENIDALFASFKIKKIDDIERVKLLKLLEMQRFAMLMYTSCGWFFDEISGIETVQVIQYASRAVQLLKEITGENIEQEFKEHLKTIPGNLPNVSDGAKVYEAHVKPAQVDLHRVAAHYAIASLFEEEAERNEIFSFEVKDHVYELLEAGRQRMSIGRVAMRSKITFEQKMFSFAFLHLGDHNINGGVRDNFGEEEFLQMKNDLQEPFQRLNIAEIILLIDKHFGSHSYTIWHLFKDKSRRIFNKILKNTLADIEISFRRIYENHYAVVHTMQQSGNPLPKAILTAVEFTINSEIRKILENPQPINTERLRNLFNEAGKWFIELDKSTLSYVASKRINSLMEKLKENPLDHEVLEEIETSLSCMVGFSIGLNVWKAQNILFIIAKENFGKIHINAENGDKEAIEWIQYFEKLENLLQVRIPKDAYTKIDIQTAV